MKTKTLKFVPSEEFEFIKLFGDMIYNKLMEDTPINLAIGEKTYLEKLNDMLEIELYDWYNQNIKNGDVIYVDKDELFICNETNFSKNNKTFKITGTFIYFGDRIGYSKSINVTINKETLSFRDFLDYKGEIKVLNDEKPISMVKIISELEEQIKSLK